MWWNLSARNLSQYQLSHPGSYALLVLLRFKEICFRNTFVIVLVLWPQKGTWCRHVEFASLHRVPLSKRLTRPAIFFTWLPGFIQYAVVCCDLVPGNHWTEKSHLWAWRFLSNVLLEAIRRKSTYIVQIQSTPARGGTDWLKSVLWAAVHRY
jgi:hypothetical protein